MEDEVLASAGVDSFEEIFKLIFAKLYDELVCERDAGAYLKFRNAGETDFELKEKIQGLFDDAKKNGRVFLQTKAKFCSRLLTLPFALLRSRILNCSTTIWML